MPWAIILAVGYLDPKMMLSTFEVEYHAKVNIKFFHFFVELIYSLHTNTLSQNFFRKETFAKFLFCRKPQKASRKYMPMSPMHWSNIQNSLKFEDIFRNKRSQTHPRNNVSISSWKKLSQRMFSGVNWALYADSEHSTAVNCFHDVTVCAVTP